MRLAAAWIVFAAACGDPLTPPDIDGAPCASSSSGMCGAPGVGGAGSGGTGGHGGAGLGGGAGWGCIWPNDLHPVSGSGFDAYEGVVAVEEIRTYQICPVPTRDARRIENGRFELSASGYGTAFVYLDINGDDRYQRNEPAWHAGFSVTTRVAVTPADFDAEKVLQFDIDVAPGAYRTHLINIAVCSTEDVLENLSDASPCSVRSFPALPGGKGSQDLTRLPASVAWAVWLIAQDVPGLPFDRRWPHRVGYLSTPPCAVDGDLTTCSVSIVDPLPDGGAVDSGVAVDGDRGSDAILQG